MSWIGTGILANGRHPADSAVMLCPFRSGRRCISELRGPAAMARCPLPSPPLDVVLPPALGADDEDRLEVALGEITDVETGRTLVRTPTIPYRAHWALSC